mgnify:CR=1 FL=1
MKHITLDAALPLKQSRPVLADGTLDQSKAARLELLREAWQEADRDEDEPAKARLAAEHTALHESCCWQEDWLILKTVVLMGRQAARHGYARSSASPPPVNYEEHLRMHPDVWKHALKTDGGTWGRAFYPCATCKGWSLVNPGCSACHDQAEVAASATGDYPTFSFEPVYQPQPRTSP